MGWKNWPYWLKGGIILSVIPLCVILIYFMGFFGDSRFFVWISQLAYAPGLMLGLITLGLIGCGSFFNNPSYCEYISFPIIILMNTTIYFIIGASFGKYYGKLKSKKSQ